MDQASVAAQERYFPVISERLYAEAPLKDFNPGTGRIWQAYWRSESADARFKHILRAHRDAFEAELAGIQKRADFYWKDLWTLIARTPESSPAWETGRSALLPNTKLSGAEFRQRFLQEIVLECHAAFFKGLVEAGLDPLNDRPRMHLEGLSTLIRSFPWVTVAAERSLIAPLANSSLQWYRQHNVPDLKQFWTTLASWFPRQSSFVESALGELHAATMRELQQVEASSKLKIVDDAIEHAEKIRRQSPENLTCFGLLGLFYHERAICLANHKHLADALLALKKAEVFAGAQPVFAETERQLLEVLSLLRQRAARVQQALATNPSASLTVSGQQLVADARTGQSRAIDWEGSPDAARIREQRERASAASPPEPPLAEASAVPLIRIEKTAKQAGQERLADFLASRRGLRLRVQSALAVLLAAVAIGLLVRDEYGSWARDRAWSRAQTAISARNDAAALDALADFFGSPKPLRVAYEDPPGAVGLYSRTLGRWIAGKSGSFSAQDRTRITEYRRLIVDRGLDAAMQVQQ